MDVRRDSAHPTGQAAVRMSLQPLPGLRAQQMIVRVAPTAVPRSQMLMTVRQPLSSAMSRSAPRRRARATSSSHAPPSLKLIVNGEDTLP